MKTYDIWPGFRKALWAAGYAAILVFLDTLRVGVEDTFADQLWLPILVAALTFVGHAIRRWRQARVVE